VHQFTYLGSTITSDAKIDKEIDCRLAKANSAFGRLYERVWNNKHLKITTNISVYRAVVITTLLYGSQSWVTYRSHLRLLERFHQRCLRTILGIHWSDFTTNVEVLEQAGITSIETMLLRTQVRWAGMSLVYTSTAYQRLSYMVSSPLVTVTEGILERDAKTA